LLSKSPSGRVFGAGFMGSVFAGKAIYVYPKRSGGIMIYFVRRDVRVVVFCMTFIAQSAASEPQQSWWSRTVGKLFGQAQAEPAPCPQCHNRQGTGPVVQNYSDTPSSGSVADGGTVVLLPSSGSGGMSEEGRLSLEREHTRQLELLVAGELQKEHERGRWTATMIEYSAEHAAQTKEADLKQTQELLRQHHEFLEGSQSKHHDVLRELEVARGKNALEKERIRQENLPALLEHDRQKTKQLHEQAMQKLVYVGEGIAAFTKDKERLTFATLSLCGLALGVYAAKRGTKVGSDYLAARLMQPALASETSKISIGQAIRHPIRTFSKKPLLPPALYNADLQSQVDAYVKSVNIRSRNNLPPRNALFHGLPGVGKTLVAKSIARDTNRPYVIVPGANLSQYSGPQAIQQMNRLLQWAEVQRAIIFFDEVDAWAKRRDGSISELTCQLQNTFYGLTGTGQERFLVLAATNNPESLDPAMLSRLNEWIKFTLPNVETRYKLFEFYVKKDLEERGITIAKGDKAIALEWASKMTEGCSGRDIQNIVGSLHDAVCIAGDKQLHRSILRRVIQNTMKQRDELYKGKLSEKGVS